MIPLASSNLRAAGYAASSARLTIHFRHGGVYEYQRVPPQIFQALLRAASPGGYFHASIKHTYPWRKVSR